MEFIKAKSGGTQGIRRSDLIGVQMILHSEGSISLGLTPTTFYSLNYIIIRNIVK